MDALDVDRKILAYLRRNPGTNTEQTARALLVDYSGSYVKNRILTMIARGMVRAEVSAANRYRLFVAETAPEVEA